MKTKKTTKKAKMTDAEIKEAIQRDKEWMDNIGPDDEIEIPEGGVNALFGDDEDEPSEKNSPEGDVEDAVDEEEDVIGEEEREADEEDDETGEEDDDDTIGTSGAGGILGALIGGIGGVVIGGILGTALFDD